jgi:hypothetical protein
MQYHPDKSGNTEWADGYFKKINEAYQVLSNPDSRKAFHLQYYANSDFNILANNSIDILTACIQLLKKVEQQGDNINEEAVVLQLEENILCSYNLAILKSESAQEYVENIQQKIILLMAKLGYKNVVQIKTILAKKLPISSNSSMSVQVQQLLKEKKQTYYWDKYKFLVALITAILICLGIYKMA